MRKTYLAALLMVAAALCTSAQDVSFQKGQSTDYLVYTDAGTDVATAVAQGMESALKLYNGLLHFDTSVLVEKKLRIRLFSQKADFDAYLTSVISGTRKNYVYIHYSSPEKSELVAYQKADIRDMVYSLVSQGFIQYLKAFVPDAPLWLQEGTAIYLANCSYRQEDGTLSWKPNFSWLETLRRLDQSGKLIPLQDLLVMTREGAAQRVDAFYPEAWALVHFLLESESRSYNRIFWDAVSAMDPAATLEQNSAAVASRAFRWENPQTLSGDFRLFVAGLKSFNDLVQVGVESYKAGKLSEADGYFTQAMLLDEESYIPYYYLGLIRYGQKKYFDAAQYYEKAEKYGADVGLVRYALGVNAYANSQLDEATTYLAEAADRDPAKYGDEVAKIQQRIKAER
jgi:tetratricopeptide (TPR) repeat protein